MKSILEKVNSGVHSLCATKEGETVKIHSIDSGIGAKGRLLELGIYPGEKIKIVRNGRSGPLLVLVKGSTFMLGRGMTEKIFVK